MKTLSVLKLEEGMYLKENIRDFDNEIVIKKGKRLSNEMIDTILNLGISKVKIDDTELKKHNNLLEINKYISYELKNYSVDFITNNFILGHKDYKSILKLNVTLINLFLKDNIFVKIMRAIKKYDSYTFYHSINVYVYSLIIGYYLRFDTDEMEQLGLGALIHDVGKLKIEPEILKKAVVYSDTELAKIKCHPTIGYKLIKNTDYTNDVKNIVYSHHEKLDGSGYPNGEKKISKLSKLVAVADRFDLFVNDRIKKRSLGYINAVKEMKSKKYKKYDLKFLEVIYNHIPIYHEGCSVLLNDGSLALIIKKNNKSPKNPIVKIIKKNGKSLPKAYEVDLNKKRELKIIKILD